MFTNEIREYRIIKDDTRPSKSKYCVIEAYVIKRFFGVVYDMEWIVLNSRYGIKRIGRYISGYSRMKPTKRKECKIIISVLYKVNKYG